MRGEEDEEVEGRVWTRRRQVGVLSNDVARDEIVCAARVWRLAASLAVVLLQEVGSARDQLPAPRGNMGWDDVVGSFRRLR